MAYLLGDANGGSPGRLGGVVAGNRAMTIAELVSLSAAGPAYQDTDQSSAELYTHINAASYHDVNDYASFQQEGGTGAISVTTEDAYTGTRSIKISGDASSTAASLWHSGLLNTAVPGKEYEISVYSRLTDTHDITYPGLIIPIDGVSKWEIYRDGVLSVDGSGYISTTAWQHFVIRIIPTTTYMRIRFYSRLNTLPAIIHGILIDNFSIKRVGVTTDLQPSGIQLAPGQWLESAHNKHVHIPDGAKLINSATTGQVRGTNTWSAATTLQYITGVNAPVLPANSVLRLYAKATVSGTFDLGDGVDQDRFGVGVTIGTSWTPITLALVAHDATNRDLTITPSASYTGTVDTCWMVEIVR